MTARTLTSLVSLVVGSLNKGETILPQSTYTGMIRTEVAQLRAGLSEKMQAACATHEKAHHPDYFHTAQYKADPNPDETDVAKQY